jgi:uncharacterized phage protein (TIGR01671 family)
MREILFRGKRKDDGEWEEGSLVIFTDYDAGLKEYWITHPGQTVDFLDDRQYEVIPETVGQYTGLTDKNGTKIFEGDIIREDYEYKNLPRYVVEMDDDRGGGIHLRAEMVAVVVMTRWWTPTTVK